MVVFKYAKRGARQHTKGYGTMKTVYVIEVITLGGGERHEAFTTIEHRDRRIAQIDRQWGGSFNGERVFRMWTEEV